MNSDYAGLSPEEINRLIALRKLTDGQNWCGDLNAAMLLLAEACLPSKKSKYTRTLSVTVETREGLPWYEVTNIFIQEDDGDILLLPGWNDKTDPVILFEGPGLAPLCCLAWLKATEPAKNYRKQKDKPEDKTVYAGLFKAAQTKRTEAIISDLKTGLHDLGYDIEQPALEAIVEKALSTYVFPD